MLTAILWGLFYLIIAVIIIEIIFYILRIIFPVFVIDTRIRGLVYALLFILVIIWVINHLGVIHLH